MKAQTQDWRSVQRPRTRQCLIARGGRNGLAASGPHCHSGDRVQGSAPDCQVQLKQLDSWTFPKAKVPILNKASVSVIGNRAFHTA